MANRHRGECDVTLRTKKGKDQVYTICYDLNAIADFEDRIGYGVAALSKEGLAGINMIRTGLFVGLQRYNRKEFRSVEQVGDAMDTDRFEEYSTAFSTCLAVAMGANPEDLEEDADEEEEEEAEGTPDPPEPKDPPEPAAPGGVLATPPASGTGVKSSPPPQKSESTPQASGG